MATFVHRAGAAGESWKAVIRKPRAGVRLRVKTFRLKADAEAWARKTESEIERGVWREVGAADHLTLGDALLKYEREESPKHRGAEIEAYNIGALRQVPLAKIRLAQVEHGSVRALRDKWIAQGYAVGTVNRRLTVLLAVFNVARRDWGMPALSNPVEGLRLKGATQRARRVSDAEIDALCAVTASSFLPVLVRLAVETGMRRGELCKMTWSMLDLDTGVARLPASITKASRSRAVPLSPRAVQLLQGWQEREAAAKRKTAPVFGIDSHAVTTALMRACKRGRKKYEAQCQAEGTEPDPWFLSDLHFHDLRHEACSRLAKTFALHELMKIVGHSSSAMMMRYYHPSAEDFAQRLRERSMAGPHGDGQTRMPVQQSKYIGHG